MLKRFTAEPTALKHRSVGTTRERRLRCASCGSGITSEADRIQVHGAHVHAVVNPHDFHFRIGCFRVAPGCQCTGDASPEFTWFPGFRWRVAVCARCRGHLGWGYQDTDTTTAFFGLIFDRLQSGGGD